MTIFEESIMEKTTGLEYILDERSLNVSMRLISARDCGRYFN